MKITISALGVLKTYLPHEKSIDLEESSRTLWELIREDIGIPDNITRIGFVVNGRIQKGTYQLQADDKIVIVVMGGAG